MKLPIFRRRREQRTRGQAMVEFAIILPVLALLMVLSLDFGRVFFGWVGLQNVARVGANYAAAEPRAFHPLTPPGERQTRMALYAQEVANEASGLNCSPLPQASPVATYLPEPSFDDANGNGVYDLNELVTVRLSCSFGLLTPLAEAILGGDVDVVADAVFPVRGGTIAGVPVTGTLPSPTPSPSESASASADPSSSASGSESASEEPSASACPLPIANFVASPTKGKAPLTVRFNDTSQTFGCAVSGWFWEFGDGSTSTVQNPTHTFHGNNKLFEVRLTVTAPGGVDSQFEPGYIETCNNC